MHDNLRRNRHSKREPMAIKNMKPPRPSSLHTHRRRCVERDNVISKHMPPYIHTAHFVAALCREAVYLTCWPTVVEGAAAGVDMTIASR